MQIGKEFMTEKEKEEAKKILLQMADDPNVSQYNWVMEYVEKIKKNEEVDDDILYKVYMFNNAFNLIWDCTHKNS